MFRRLGHGEHIGIEHVGRYLHFGVDYARVFTFAGDVVHFGQEILIPEKRKQDVIEVNWKYVQESSRPCRVDGVASVVSGGPSISAIRQAPVGHQVQDFLVGIVLAVTKQ